MLLLLNVIIASLSKIFDAVYESISVNANLVSAKLVDSGKELPVALPPLNLLGMPARAIAFIYTFSVRCTGARHDGYGRLQEGGAKFTPVNAEDAAVVGLVADMASRAPDLLGGEDERWRRALIRRLAAMEDRLTTQIRQMGSGFDATPAVPPSLAMVTAGS